MGRGSGAVGAAVEYLEYLDDGMMVDCEAAQSAPLLKHPIFLLFEIEVTAKSAFTT